MRKQPIRLKSLFFKNRHSIYIACIILASSSYFLSLQPVSAATITVDGAAAGRTFEGFGTLSAGAPSKLLYDYPEPQRSQVLDYLFLPNYGASFHILKVEIGGDVNSTCGTEPAFAHTIEEFNNPKQEYFDRGYETWLMLEAKKRNPNIIIYSLQWGAPNLIGTTIYCQQNVRYIITYVKKMKEYFGLDINWVGGWNETWSGHQTQACAYFKMLRKGLDSAGLTNVKINAADGTAVGGNDNGWTIANYLLADPDLMNAVTSIGSHDDPGHAPQNAKDLLASHGKTLWMSESPPWAGDWSAAADIAKRSTNLYLLDSITAWVRWSLVTGSYDNMSLPGNGTMYANTPWSGYYNVEPAIWVYAHTNQFVKPGWKYLNPACMPISGGSVVALKSPNTTDYSIIAQTMDASSAQPLAVKISGGLSTGAVHVWKTNATAFFIKQPDIVPVNGSFSLSLEPKSVYSLTTTTGQSKGNATPLPQKSFPFPYYDNFEGYAADKLPKYFADENGVFETDSAIGRGGMALAQKCAPNPIFWNGNGGANPVTFVGDVNWKNYEVSADVYINSIANEAGISGRLTTQASNGMGFQWVSWNQIQPGYWFSLAGSGGWTLKTASSTLASGTTSASAGKWRTLKLAMQSDTICAYIDGVRVSQVKNSTYASGMAGLSASFGNRSVQFDNFSVDNVGATTAVRSMGSGHDLHRQTASPGKTEPFVLFDLQGRCVLMNAEKGMADHLGRCKGVYIKRQGTNSIRYSKVPRF